MRPMLIAILTWAASAAAGADDCRAVDQLMPTLAARMAEFSNRDKSWTTACIGARGVSQVAADAALTKRRSFQAEGTGLEPATGCPASDFESDSSPFGYPPGLILAASRLGKTGDRAARRSASSARLVQPARHRYI